MSNSIGKLPDKLLSGNVNLVLVLKEKLGSPRSDVAIYPLATMMSALYFLVIHPIDLKTLNLIKTKGCPTMVLDGKSIGLILWGTGMSAHALNVCWDISIWTTDQPIKLIQVSRFRRGTSCLSVVYIPCLPQSHFSCFFAFFPQTFSNIY